MFFSLIYLLSVEVFTVFMMRLIHSSIGILVSSVCLSRSAVSVLQTGTFISLVQGPGITFLWQCGLVLWLKAGWNNWRIPVKELTGLWNSEACMRAEGSLVEFWQVPKGGKGPERRWLSLASSCRTWSTWSPTTLGPYHMWWLQCPQ